MSINISNKKYAILEEPIIRTKDTVLSENGDYPVPYDYSGWGLIRVRVPEPIYEEITISPMITEQIITPSTGKNGISKVTVNPVTHNIDSDIKPENILDGITILGVEGEVIELHSAPTLTVTANTAASQTFTPTGNYNAYTKVIVNKITDSNLKSENIRKDISILGVTGNLIESNEIDRDITENGYYTPQSPYTGFNEINVDVKAKPVSLTINPSTSDQTFNAIDEYHSYTPIIAKKVTADIDADILPQNILDGVNILGVTGKIVLDNITINPEIVEQNITHPKKNGVNGGYNTIKVNPVTAAIDSDIISSNIRKDVEILGVTGNIIELLGETKTVNPEITTKTYTPSNGKNAFTSFTVNAVTASIDSDIQAGNIRKGVNILGVDGSIDFETLTVNPTTSQQIFNPTKDGYSKVTVNEVTSNIDSDIQPTNIKQGVNILGVNGSVIELKGKSLEVVATTQEQNITPPSGYNGFTSVKISAVDSDIDPNLTPTNIKDGVTILGVTGSVVELKGQTKEITANGTYTPTGGKNGFTQVTVDVDTVNNTTLTINPSTTSQSFVVSTPYTGYNNITANPVTSAIDSDIKAENIKSGINILGVTGNVVELKGQTKTLSLTSTSETTITPDTSYNGLTSVKVSPKNKDLNITPSESSQTFNIPANYSGHGKVVVSAAPLQTKTLTVNASTSTSVTVTPDNNYFGLSSVTLDMSWIESQLQALNAGDSSTSTINLQNKTLSSAGTYTCDDGYDGFGEITINLDWVDEAIAQASEGKPDGTGDALISGEGRDFVTDADQVRDYAFYKHNNLRLIALNNATVIGRNAFEDSGITTLIIRTPSVCTLGQNALDGTALTDIYVPSNLVTQYQNDTKWSSYSSIIQPIV